MQYIELPSSKGTIRIPIIGESEDQNANPKKTGWSASGKLVSSFPNTPARSRGLTLQVNFGEKVDGSIGAGYYTIQFQVSPITEVPTVGTLIRARAEITWSVEGNFVTRVLQVSNGSSISGVGQAVYIKIADDSILDSEFGEELEYLCSVQVAKGTRPSTNQPPLLQPRTISTVVGGASLPSLPPYVVADNSTISVPVPENTGIINVFMQAQSLADVTDPRLVQFEFLARSIQLSFANWGAIYRWVPLPPGTNEIQVFNNSGNSIFWTPIFGIEG